MPRWTPLLLVATLSACQLWPLGGSPRDLSRLYFKEPDMTVRTEWLGTPATPADAQAFVALVRSYRTAGMFSRIVPGAQPPGAATASSVPVYAFAEPTLTVAALNPIELTEAQQTAEPVLDPSGALRTVRVAKQPLYFLKQLRVKWTLTGLEAPPEQVLDLQVSMRAQEQQLPRIPMTHASNAVRAVLDAGGSTLGIRGRLDVELTAQDLDPLKLDSQREVKVTRTLPVLFTAGSVLLGEALAGASPTPLGPLVGGGALAAPVVPNVEPQASASPSVAPSASPTATPSAP
ncbi:MAG: hypothetical protein VKS61_12655 [Candidatus Sericytochromatia bacterium]|nr:hypothetical protein [Candidatus Sericytochromatia bacterium]